MKVKKELGAGKKRGVHLYRYFLKILKKYYK
jgi:hypothetical protein